MNKTLIMVALALCMASSNAAAQEWAPAGVGMGGSREPVPMPQGVFLSDVMPEFTPSLPEGYYLNDAEYDGQAFILLYRDSAGGGTEILMSVVQEEAVTHSVTSVEGSHEASGRNSLYFMLVNGNTLHGSLYRFDMAMDRMSLVLGEPCSNNMAVQEDVPPEDAGLGWVLHEDRALPVRLKDGAVLEDRAVTITMLGGLGNIEGSFFEGPQETGYFRYSYLTPLPGGGLRVTTVDWSPAAGEFGQTVENFFRP